MTNIDKAVKILKATNEGHDLPPHHKKIVEPFSATAGCTRVFMTCLSITKRLLRLPLAALARHGLSDQFPYIPPSTKNQGKFSW